MSLDIIRTKGGWFTKGILLLLAAAFIFSFGYGATSLRDMRGTSGNAAAEVNGEEIPLSEFVRLRENYRRQNPQMGELSPDQLQSLNLRILEYMVDEKLLSQKARELGLRVTDQELNDFIQTAPLFQVDGQFVGAEQYQQIVKQVFKITPGQFEDVVRGQILAMKMEQIIYETALITEEELYNVYLRQNERVNLYYIPFLSKDYIDSYTPSDEEIQKHFDQSKDNYKTDETRSVRYITINAEDFENKIEVSDEEITAYYNAYPEEFKAEDGSTKPFEDVRGEIATILSSQSGGALREEFVEALRAEGGTDKTIDELAAEYNKETINESEQFAQSDILKEIPPRVTRIAFEEEQGGTAIIDIGTAIWVIEVKDVTPSEPMNIEQAKETITKELKENKSKQVTRQKAQEALNELKTSKKSELPEKVKALGLELSETGYFNRLQNVPNINNEALRTEAFELNEATVVSNKLYNSNDDFFIVSVKEKESADKEVFNQEKDALKQQELIRQQSNLRLNWLQNLRRESKISPNASLFPPQG